MHGFRAVVVTLITSFSAASAFAHPGEHNEGVVGGLLHPLVGIDHLLTAVMLGLCLYCAPKRSVVSLGLCFLATLTIGFAWGFNFGGLAVREDGIIFCSCAVAALLMFGRPIHTGFLYLLFALCGLLHGHAHGTEVLPGSSSALFFLGFLLATSVLTLAGYSLVVAMQNVLNSKQRIWVLRMSAVVGVLILALSLNQ